VSDAERCLEVLEGLWGEGFWVQVFDTGPHPFGARVLCYDDTVPEYEGHGQTRLEALEDLWAVVLRGTGLSSWLEDEGVGG
jgi:hypothetical protein